MSPSINKKSPANSVEAFAEPRRRGNVADISEKNGPDPVPNAHKLPRVVLNDDQSCPAIVNQRQSFSSQPRRPSLSNSSVPPDHIQTVRPSDACETTYASDSAELFRPTFDVEDHEPDRSLKINYEVLENLIIREPHSPRINATNILNTTSSPDFQNLEKQSSSLTGITREPSGVESGDLVSHDSNQNCPRFRFFSSCQETTIQAPDLGGLLVNGVASLRDLFQTHESNGSWWLDVFDPSDAELSALGHAFSLHRLTIEDIQTHEWREKVELFRHYYFVCFRTFTMPEGEGVPDYVNVYMVVFREGIITFSLSERTAHAQNVCKRIAKRRETPALSSDWICYAMIDDIVDSFGPITREVEKEAGIVEDEVFIARQEDFGSLLQRIGTLRKKVMSLLRLLSGKVDVIKGLAKRCNERYEATPWKHTGLYHGDIQDHVVTMLTNLSHLEKMLSGLHGNYLASLFVKDIMVGNHINSALTKITILATFLVPLTILTLLFGMNVSVPGQDQGIDWFWGIVAIMAAIGIIGAFTAMKYKLF